MRHGPVADLNTHGRADVFLDDLHTGQWFEAITTVTAGQFSDARPAPGS